MSEVTTADFRYIKHVLTFVAAAGKVIMSRRYLSIHLLISIYLGMDLEYLEKISKALADINRLKILEDMSKKGGVIQYSDIVKVLELAQPSVSYHIKRLIKARLIEPEKSGRNYSYTLNKRLLKNYLRKLKTLVADF